jgi:hypothetical protein
VRQLVRGFYGMLVDLIDSRTGRPFAKRMHQVTERVPLTRRFDLYAAVRQIAHPARDSAAPCGLSHEPAISNALNTSPHAQVNAQRPTRDRAAEGRPTPRQAPLHP